MAIRIPIITDLQDQGIKQAKLAFGNFKSAVGNAEGGLGKFKAGATSIMTSVGQHAGHFAAAGVAAFGAFALSGMNAFKDLALEAGKFAGATGLGVEDASRWKEVAGDIGVGTETLQTAIGKLNKVIGTTPNKLKNLGIELVYLRDGSLDVNATFLNTIQHLKSVVDPAQRAKEATILLGKGWQSMAELINLGSVELTDSLRSVSDEQVISADELQKAKDYRDATNDLGDAWTKLKLQAGQSLIPLATDIVKIGASIVGAFSGKDVESVIKEFYALNAQNIKDSREEIDLLKVAIRNAAPLPVITNTFEKLRDAVKEVAVEMSADAYEHFRETQKTIIDVINPDKIDNYKNKFEGLAGIMGADAWERFFTTFDNPILYVIPDRIDKIKSSLDKAVISTNDAKSAWSNLVSQFERQVSFDKLDTDLETLKEKAIAAFGGGKKEMDEFHAAQLTVAEDFAKFATNFPPELSTKISVAIDSGDLAQLAWAAGTVKFLSNPIGLGGNDASIYRRVENQTIPARANGGPVMAGGSYLVGERGPELFTPGSSGNITPNNAMGGNTITVNVNGGDPNQVVAAIQRWVRDNGAIPMTTTTAIRR